MASGTVSKSKESFIGSLGNGLTLQRAQMRPHLTITDRIIQNPQIVYDLGFSVTPAFNGTWRTSGRFIRCGGASEWGLVRYGNSIEVKMRKFQNDYVNMCNSKGVEIPERPILIGTVDQRGLRYFFQEAKRLKVEFLVVISDKSIDIQDELKCLERHYEVATQNINANVANKAIGHGRAILENIIQKTNLKLGGTNYTIRHQQKFIDDAFGKNCLIIGVSLSHSGAVDDVQRARGAESTSLSAVGYAANTGIDPFEFIGDYLPNNPHRSEILDLIPGIIQATINKFHQNRNMFPSSMLLYFNGSSEGDFLILKRFEIPLVFKKMIGIIGHKLPLTVIIRQRINISHAGTGLVHFKINEFYLNFQSAIQGTARTPKYTIIHNDNINVGMDAIQHITYYLCFCHRIGNSATSLPSPVYVASAYAQRGTKMYRGMEKIGVTPNPDDIAENWIYDTSVFFRNKRIVA
uniref:Piwi domain-containing protein n=1 Tax=Panagrolaimus superbus TaxID=310955 RepID=A0A914YJY4_9BILA